MSHRSTAIQSSGTEASRSPRCPTGPSTTQRTNRSTQPWSLDSENRKNMMSSFLKQLQVFGVGRLEKKENQIVTWSLFGYQRWRNYGSCPGRFSQRRQTFKSTTFIYLHRWSRSNKMSFLFYFTCLTGSCSSESLTSWFEEEVMERRLLGDHILCRHTPDSPTDTCFHFELSEGWNLSTFTGVSFFVLLFLSWFSSFQLLTVPRRDTCFVDRVYIYTYM